MDVKLSENFNILDKTIYKTNNHTHNETSKHESKKLVSSYDGFCHSGYSSICSM